jgi:hypothetical protein
VNSTSGCLDKIDIERKNHLVSALFGQYPFNMGYSIYWWSNRKNSFLLIGPWNVASSDALLSAFCWPSSSSSAWGWRRTTSEEESKGYHSMEESKAKKAAWHG